MKGSVTDVQIWDRYSHQDTLQAWSLCVADTGGDGGGGGVGGGDGGVGGGGGGNVFNWETGEVRSEELEKVEVERRTVCRQEELKYLAFATKRNFLQSQQFCRTLSGAIAVAAGPESVRKIQQSLETIGGKQVRSYVCSTSSDHVPRRK